MVTREPTPRVNRRRVGC